MSGIQQYFGKYRGTVVNNIDPEQRGRIQAYVPDVLGVAPSVLGDAVPACSRTAAGFYAVPPVGAGVWIEFEQGDPDYPIWSGCWWGSLAEVPAMALAAPPAVPIFVLQTTGQNRLVISDAAGVGGIRLIANSGAMILIDETGITITNGQGALIKLSGKVVDINLGALTIT